MIIRFAALAAIMTALCAAQSTGQGATAGQPADWAPSALSNLSFEPVGPGDLIQIYVASLPEITRSYRISKDGTITLPMVKKTLSVNRMTAGEIEKEVTKAVVDARLLVDPVVSVAVLEYRSKPVNVVGAVNFPLTLQAIGGLRLLDALAKANGLAPTAGPEIIVSRPEIDGQPAYMRHILVKELMGSSDPLLNFPLQGGEEIRVPAAISDKIYITGNVKTPGAYSLDQLGKLTLLQALALCQGTLSFTQSVAVIYRPTPGSSARQEIDVPLKAILHRHAPDMALLPNDILYIPENSGRRLSAAVLERIATVGGATASGVIVYGKY
jgi:polysaccharide export outer membrane protein